MSRHELLRELLKLYKQKEWLPNPKDVRQFLGRFTKETVNISNRDSAFTKMEVFVSLDKCTNEELEEFIQTAKQGEDGKFSAWCDIILNTN